MLTATTHGINDHFYHGKHKCKKHKRNSCKKNKQITSQTEMRTEKQNSQPAHQTSDLESPQRPHGPSLPAGPPSRRCCTHPTLHLEVRLGVFAQVIGAHEPFRALGTLESLLARVGPLVPLEKGRRVVSMIGRKRNIPTDSLENHGQETCQHPVRACKKIRRIKWLFLAFGLQCQLSNKTH